MEPIGTVSAYRLSLIGAIVVMILSVAALIALGGPQNAAPYITLVGTVAVPALLALFRSEQNAQQNATNHAANQDMLQALLTENKKVTEALQPVATNPQALEEAKAALKEMQP